MTITLNRTDLDFLLTQVTINYLKPDPNNPGQFIPTVNFNYSALANALDPSGLREVAGTNNNLVGGYFDPNIINPLTGEPGVWVPGPNSTCGQSSQPFLNLSVGQEAGSAPEAGYNNSGTGTAGTNRAVSDADPRLISNLVTTMFTSGAIANPAAAATATNQGPFAANAQFGGLQVNGQDTAFVANAGVLGGGRYNEWFVSFGQFFDHGLDFVNRDTDPNATVTVNLSPLDPLYSLGADGVLGGTGANADVTSIQVRRAAISNASDAGTDGIFGTADDRLSNGADCVAGTADDIYSKPKYINQTGLLIDQSQTYGSHESVNALIREYDADGSPTGRVVSGNTAVLDTPSTADDVNAKGLATWADIKANALRIGVELDANPSHFANIDIHNAPRLRVDPVGKLMFTPGAIDWTTTDPWYKQILLDDPLFDTGTPFDYSLQSANDPFLRDANGNVQRTGQNMLMDFNPGQSLDSHVITGDGRANENIGLMSAHHVFHEEHNAQVENVKASILATGDAAFIAEWQTSPGVWDGEKLYQATRLITESEYNHIAIDQYVGTLYGALPEFVSYSSDINPGVSLEFSQAVFRLGHSMLTETFNVTDPETGQPLRLLDMFLNPTKYQAMLDVNGNPADLVNGLLTTLGNEVDEFVTPALQQSLLGQPLDLATINIARGRDVNLPTWNEFRDQLYNQYIQNTNNTNSSALAPYTSWADVFDHLKSPLTGVNLIAAYARGNPSSADGLYGTLNDGDHDLTDAIVQARADYLSGTGTLQQLRGVAQDLYNAYLNVDSVGNPIPPGNPVDEARHDEAVAFMEGEPVYNPATSQWEFTGADKGFWDIDLWIGGLAERPLFDGPLGTTFSYVILDFAQRQQDGDRFYYLYRTPMGTHLGDEIIRNQFTNLVMENTGLQHLNGEIFIWSSATFELDGIDTDGPAGPDVGLTDIDANDDINDYFNAATHTIFDVDGTPMKASLGHLVIAGNEGHDFIIAGLGDDTVYGDDGNDTIQGNQGNDHLFGGAGNDLILDDENDDFIDGGAGDDIIFAGPGVLDTVFGGDGDDEIHGGDGIDELMGGAGDDMIYGDGDTDVIFGEDGNDFMDGGDSVDEMWGGNGHDWMRGGVGDDHLNGGDGNDLLEGGIGAAANDGDRLIGGGGLDFGLVAPPDTGFDVVSYEDVNIAITANLHTSNENGTGGLLDTYAQIEGLVGSRFNDNLTGAGTDTFTTNGANNMLVGGAGYDVLTGLSGDDQIFGDSVVVTNDLSVWDGVTPYSTITNWKGTGEDRPDFGPLGGLGHFLGDNGAAGTADRAVFSGQRDDYTISLVDASTVIVVDNRGIDSTTLGDLVRDVELFHFQVLDVDGNDVGDDIIAFGALTIDNLAPVLAGPAPTFLSTEDTPLSDTVAGAWTDPDSLAPLTFVGQGALHGTVVMNADGTFTYTPTANYFGADRISYTVSDGIATVTGTAFINLAPVNDAPVANPDALTATRNAPVTVAAAALLGNDADVDGDTLTILSVSNGVNGTVVLNPDGTVTFTPSANFVGQATFTYIATDGTADSAPATVTVNVINRPPVANPDTVTTAQDTPLVINPASLTGNDTDADGDPISIASVASGTGGTAVLNGDGTVTFTHDANFFGAASFTYRVSDGLADSAPATVTVIVDAAPIDIIWNGVSPSNTALPGSGALIATLGTVDPDHASGFTYSLVAPVAGFAVSAAGNVTRTSAMAVGLDTTLTIRSTDPFGVSLDEVFHIRASSTFNNTLNGVAGTDIFYGFLGNDTLNGNGGDDTLFGQSGNDKLNGGTGNDVLDGGSNSDVLNGDDGDDTLFGQSGNDTLNGGTGNDVLDGGTGGDTLNGNEGDDTLIVQGPDSARDNLTGGAGVDTADFSAFTANLTVTLDGWNWATVGGTCGGANADRVRSVENFTGGSGNDTINGDGNVNVLTGGGGNDTINGGGGDDFLAGGSGADRIIVDQGNDTIIFSAGFGDDVVVSFDADATGGQDLLDVSGLGILASEFATDITLVNAAGGVLIEVRSDGVNLDGTIKLLGVAVGQISDADFLFA